MAQPNPVRCTSLEDCVEATLTRVGKHIVLGLPAAIGKPTALVNAFVQRALEDRQIRLTIITALSLRAPRWRGELERRLLEPLAARLFADHTELDYVRLLEEQRLPSNIEVLEFYLEPGVWLDVEHFQQHHLSVNYTHVVREALRRGLNVLAQYVAAPRDGEAPSGVLSLGSNTDFTADLLPQIVAMRAADKPFVLIGQIHNEMPFMYGDALVSADTFDYLIERTAPSLFGVPKLPVSAVEHAIALNVSTLIRDGGTLQLGGGTLGDAVVHALKLRHEQPAAYREIIESSGLLTRYRRLIESEGGTAPFTLGLYGCTEVLGDGFLQLYYSGILKRRVYPSARLQRLIDAGRVDEEVGLRTLEALHAAGMRRMSFADFDELREVGLFRDDIEFESGMLIRPDGTRILASFETPEQRAEIAKTCLGSRLRNEVLLDAAFLVGPRALYEALRALPPAERKLFGMRGISFINELYGPEWELKVAQRRHARFVNATMMVTGLGAASSDALGDGRVVSGVGGQYNFVAMAHALPEARSILCLPSTRSCNGQLSSNVVWSHGHTSIPRHLRDIVVTEYGVADLRGRTDREVVEALLLVMDARFQDELVAQAKRARKLPRNYRVPDAARRNRPETLHERLGPWRAKGYLPDLPFGSDFTVEECMLAKALRALEARNRSWSARLGMSVRALVQGSPKSTLAPLFARMDLAQPRSMKERFYRRILAAALEAHVS
ncbi:MAG: acetyl-CoA hydrolase/transferase C-terminal domain-containing protein [Gammaproteobacteria bacterium]|nr:hypothetical protein [Gammaproteobacteria bacterium]